MIGAYAMCSAKARDAFRRAGSSASTAGIGRATGGSSPLNSSSMASKFSRSSSWATVHRIAVGRFDGRTGIACCSPENARSGSIPSGGAWNPGVARCGGLRGDGRKGQGGGIKARRGVLHDDCVRASSHGRCGRGSAGYGHAADVRLRDSRSSFAPRAATGEASPRLAITHDRLPTPCAGLAARTGISRPTPSASVTDVRRMPDQGRSRTYGSMLTGSAMTRSIWPASVRPGQYPLWVMSGARSQAPQVRQT
jgi:hypothetical protein